MNFCVELDAISNKIFINYLSHLSIKGGVSWYYQIKLWDSRLYMMACTLKIFITQKIHILLLMKLTNVRYLYKRIQFDMCVCIYWNKNQSNINQSGFMFFYYFEIDIWIINNVEKSRNHKKLSIHKINGIPRILLFYAPYLFEQNQNGIERVTKPLNKNEIQQLWLWKF